MAAKDPALNWSDLDQRAVDTVRVLAMDAVEKSGNGHPGTAMSLAPAAYLLFNRVMRHDPTDPDWAGRDRFVLSCGHSSLTLYIQLYLSGYGLSLDDLASLRQWDSLTPGHPEHGHTPGVEVTTGPLGQGIGNAVGMAMAARRERGLFDPEHRPGQSPVRPPRLRDLLGRRHRGGRQPRVQRHRRGAEAGQPHADLRRQRDLHRGRHPDRQERGRRRALRGVRLARAARSTGARATRPRATTTRTSRRCTTAIQAAKAVTDRPSFIVLQDDHRLARAEQAEHRQDPRLRAGRRRGRRHQGDPRLRPERELRGRRQGARARPAGGHPGPRGARRVAARPSTPGRRPTTTAAKLLRPDGQARPAGGLGDGAARVPGRRRRASPPGPRPARCWRRSRRCCRSCGAARPTWPRATTPR